jgi:uncharacterized protein (TIGR01244 family)
MARFFPIQQVSPQLYRSPQPDFEDLVRFKAYGIQALINLREEAVESEFFARQCGLRYLHLSVIDWTAPQHDQVQTFLDFLQDAQHTPAVVHCAAGVGRTGTFVACYRIAQGMNPEEALRLSNAESPIAGMTLNPMQQDFVRKFAPRAQ